MKIINTKMHGVLDYVVGLFLIISPWVFNFANGGPQMWIPIILGASALVYSLVTDYELGVFKILSMKTHLMIDTASGILLAASPWIFGFANIVYLPHLVLGLFEIVAVVMTKTQPQSNYRYSTTHSHA